MTTLTRLKAQTRHKSILGMKVLMWVLYSERPLRAEELCHALGVEIRSTDLDPENVPALRILLASCFGLVKIEASTSTVRLVHFTLQEYLLNDPMLFHSPHSTIAEVCLTYLNFQRVQDLSAIVYWAPSTMPLIEYASCYWGEHATKGMTENAKLLALKLLDKFDKHISAQLLLLHYNQTRGSGPYFYGARGPTGFTGLHGVAFLGIAEIVAAVLEMKEWDVNAADCMRTTALTWATRRGHKEIVKALLEREDINPTQDGRTPLTLAAENGHETLVMMLLGRQDTNPNTADTKYGRTPLSWAVRCKHEEVVKVLLEREDVNPNAADTQDGWTPLTLAAESGDEGLVKILLKRPDTNPNKADTQDSRTPLTLAVETGHEGLVKILLERPDTNPNKADTQYGRTPLLLAIDHGHDRVVKLLLEREDVNADQECTKCGRTPLSLAAGWGNEMVVKMFLGRKDVNPNTPDTGYGQTPLSQAAEYGYAGVVKMLLEGTDVNPNAVDTEYGRTPLSWAAENGHTGVVKVLLERKDVCTTTPDSKNETPLSLALSKGHDGVVRTLQERDNVHSGTGSGSGQAPFPSSAGDGDECVVEMGLRRDDPNTDIANLIGRPLAKKLGVEKLVAKEPKKISIHKGKHVSETLEDLIINQRRGLQNMYGGTGAELNKSLGVPIKRGEGMARKLVADMGCPLEVAKDLTVLTLYDVAILIGML